jgi:hypothetical protein
MIGRTGWTSEICAEIQPVSASASNTITKVTAGLGDPGIKMMAGARGECSGQEPGEPREYEHLRAYTRAREPLTYPGRCKDSVAGLGHVRTDPFGDPSRHAYHR